jgi:hypothetical protein
MTHDIDIPNIILDAAEHLSCFVQYHTPDAITQRRIARKAAAAAAKKAAASREFWAPIIHVSLNVLKWGGIFGAAAGGAAAAVYAINRRRKARFATERDAFVKEVPFLGTITAGRNSNVLVRDCLPGEEHDFVSYEPLGEVQLAAPPPQDAPGDVGVEGVEAPEMPPPQRRGPALRRKRYHHKPYDAGGVSGPYLSHVVAEARLRYNGGPATATTEGAARDFMVRMMRGHGMRASDIDKKIAHMVYAVFYVTEEDVTQLEWRAKAIKFNRYGRVEADT